MECTGYAAIHAWESRENFPNLPIAFEDETGNPIDDRDIGAITEKINPPFEAFLINHKNPAEVCRFYASFGKIHNLGCYILLKNRSDSSIYLAKAGTGIVVSCLSSYRPAHCLVKWKNSPSPQLEETAFAALGTGNSTIISKEASNENKYECNPLEEVSPEEAAEGGIPFPIILTDRENNDIDERSSQKIAEETTLHEFFLKDCFYPFNVKYFKKRDGKVYSLGSYSIYRSPDTGRFYLLGEDGKVTEYQSPGLRKFQNNLLPRYQFTKEDLQPCSTEHSFDFYLCNLIPEADSLIKQLLTVYKKIPIDEMAAAKPGLAICSRIRGEVIDDRDVDLIAHAASKQKPFFLFTGDSESLERDVLSLFLVRSNELHYKGNYVFYRTEGGDQPKYFVAKRWLKEELIPIALESWQSCLTGWKPLQLSIEEEFSFLKLLENEEEVPELNPFWRETSSPKFLTFEQLIELNQKNGWNFPVAEREAEDDLLTGRLARNKDSFFFRGSSRGKNMLTLVIKAPRLFRYTLEIVSQMNEKVILKHATNRGDIAFVTLENLIKILELKFIPD